MCICVCLCACVRDGYSGGPFSKLHSHCAIISRREGETRYRDRTMEPFVSHLSILSGDLCVYCVYVHLCAYVCLCVILI